MMKLTLAVLTLCLTLGSFATPAAEARGEHPCILP